jgi:hypothetical protein
MTWAHIKKSCEFAIRHGSSTVLLSGGELTCHPDWNVVRRGVYHLRGAIAPRGVDLLYYSPLDIKSDSKESTNRALFSKD